jgi:hypothetical protein
MTIEEKIEVLSRFDNEIGIGVERWDDIRILNDAGFPLANLMLTGAIEKLSEVGIKIINETFDDLMKNANIDPTDQDVESILNWLSNILSGYLGCFGSLGRPRGMQIIPYIIYFVNRYYEHHFYLPIFGYF